MAANLRLALKGLRLGRGMHRGVVGYLGCRSAHLNDLTLFGSLAELQVAEDNGLGVWVEKGCSLGGAQPALTEQQAEEHGAGGRGEGLTATAAGHSRSAGQGSE